MQERRADPESAAILAADIAAYARLTEDDEASTRIRVAAHYTELIEPKIREGGGRIREKRQDGFLVEFPRARDAVDCAVGVQRSMIDRNAGEPAHRKITFRVGVDLSEVTVPDDGFLRGDGAIMAIRLRDLAAPGGICFSGEVVDQMRERLAYPFDDAGEHVFRGIERKLRLYLLDAQTVAVLPAQK